MQSAKAIAKSKFIPGPIKCCAGLLILMVAGIVFLASNIALFTPVVASTEGDVITGKDIAIHYYNYDPSGAVQFDGGVRVDGVVFLKNYDDDHTVSGAIMFLKLNEGAWWIKLEVDMEVSDPVLLTFGIEQSITLGFEVWTVKVG